MAMGRETEWDIGKGLDGWIIGKGLIKCAIKSFKGIKYNYECN